MYETQTGDAIPWCLHLHVVMYVSCPHSPAPACERRVSSRRLALFGRHRSHLTVNCYVLLCSKCHELFRSCCCRCCCCLLFPWLPCDVMEVNVIVIIASNRAWQARQNNAGMTRGRWRSALNCVIEGSRAVVTARVALAWRVFALESVFHCCLAVAYMYTYMYVLRIGTEF